MKFQAQCQTCHLFIDVINGPGVLLAALLGEQARYIADSMKTVGSVDPSMEIGLALHLVI